MSNQALEDLFIEIRERTMKDQASKFAASHTDPASRWAEAARTFLHWDKPFTNVMEGSFAQGNTSWFSDGNINACYNCVDRWALVDPERTAIIHEPDECNESTTMTYHALLTEVCKFSNGLKELGLHKGDVAIIYMPMVPATVVAMLACARLGVIHACVFGGFSALSLRERIQDCQPKVVITADEARRAGRAIAFKSIVDQALGPNDGTIRTIVLSHTGSEVNWNAERDIWWNDLVRHVPNDCQPELVRAEDPLFILYTSGSTGKPKGLLHTTAGYLLGAVLTTRDCFDLRPGDRFGCVADVGWITGHTYVVYGPLLNGITTLVFQSAPSYPKPGRFWSMIEKHKLTQLYTAPTTIRMLRRHGDSPADSYDMKSLRALGSIGEPLNPEAWLWCYHTVGASKCAIVDTYFQTETGAIVFSPLPRDARREPGSVGGPFPGIEPVLLDPESGRRQDAVESEGVLCLQSPWPWMARTIWQDHDRFLKTYLEPFKGFYLTGDGARRDRMGNYYITGRVDDVVNVSGHRIATAEVESALLCHVSVSESAVIGVPDDITGQALQCFVTLKTTEQSQETKDIAETLRATVRHEIGGFVVPKYICICSNLPHTRSGKIIRRILRKIAANEQNVGDTTTLLQPDVVNSLRQEFSRSRAA